MKRTPIRRTQGGFTLVEILVALLITAFGLLGFAGLVSKATTLTADSTQRARGAMLLEDMAQRILSNKTNAAAYADLSVLGESTTACNDGASLVNRDRCEWNNLLAGASDGSAQGFLGFRGCIRRPDPTQPVYVVTVAWGALTPGEPPVDGCAVGVFGSDNVFRRVVRKQIRIANLTA